MDLEELYLESGMERLYLEEIKGHDLQTYLEEVEGYDSPSGEDVGVPGLLVGGHSDSRGVCEDSEDTDEDSMGLLTGALYYD